MSTIERRVSDVLAEIAADMQSDAREFDGKPFNGRTVAEYFGNQGAAIAALANIVAKQEARLDALEKVAHAPVDITEAVRDAITRQLKERS